MHQKKIIIINTKNISKIKDTNIHKFLKEKIFSGHIIIFKNLRIIKRINKEVRSIIEKSICFNLFKNSNYFLKNNLNKKYLTIERKIKESLLIKYFFNIFLQQLNFNLIDTYIDKICLRYIPKKSDEVVGNLKFTNPHRDTWASNIVQQINWWFPLIDIDSNNSIFISPKYFERKITNNSVYWSFENYLQNKNKFDSTPTIINRLGYEEKVVLKPKIGDIVCFSGHHLHGSHEGINDRLNIETRTISQSDSYKFVIPKMLDGNSEKKKVKWFKNCLTKRPLLKI